MTILLITLAIALLLNSMGKSAPKEVKEECKIHKWSIHPETNKMQCCNCNFIAGT